MTRNRRWKKRCHRNRPTVTVTVTKTFVYGDGDGDGDKKTFFRWRWRWQEIFFSVTVTVTKKVFFRWGRRWIALVIPPLVWRILKKTRGVFRPSLSNFVFRNFLGKGGTMPKNFKKSFKFLSFFPIFWPKIALKFKKFCLRRTCDNCAGVMRTMSKKNNNKKHSEF